MGYKSSVVLVALFIVAAAVLILHLSDQSMTSASDMAQKYSCSQTGSPEGNNMTYKIDKTDEEWKAVLTPEQYRITRQKGTERAFTGEFYDHHENGTYRCVCCGAELFSSNEKYDSGSGWPSFWGSVSPDNISELSDNSLGMSRTEVLCSQCGSHLGHVFDDGPKPTGLRYCVNSASLKFDPDSSEAD